jgi:DNA-binding transcriptional ArsR family regulator
VDQALKALAEPSRREILRLVGRREMPAGAIASTFEDVTRPAISQHLRVLVNAGLLAERREGRRHLYRTRPEAIAKLRSFLEEFWDERLRRLKAAAEAHDGRTRRDAGGR